MLNISALRDLEQTPFADLLRQAAVLRDAGHGRRISYSRKVFIPLTKLCRDVCHYCTFAETPKPGVPAYLSIDAVLRIAEQGRRAGCHEALFTLGDKPEARYAAARDALAALGHDSTLSYLAEAAGAVLDKTGLLPHLNPGVMTKAEMAMLRPVSASMGMMLESAADRLCERGGPHFGSPDKAPSVRLQTIEAAGELAIPFTTGILIGIGETRAERIDALRRIGELHERHGHIQEVIVQNFRAKPGTKLAGADEPDLQELLWTIAAARIILGPEMNIQAPPNLTPDFYGTLVGSGLNDWGGVSPVTPDHVNPEAPWPEIEALAKATAATGHLLVERLTIYPAYARDPQRWLDARVRPAMLLMSDAEGLARTENWAPGLPISETALADFNRTPYLAAVDRTIARAVDQATAAQRLDTADIMRLFQARDRDFRHVCEAADTLRRETVGDIVRYAVNRNINYTNICYFRCTFCAFSKGKTHDDLRGKPYDLALDEIARRVTEAWERGATEVCMQGGIHPDYTGQTYIDICHAVKRAVPDMHIHAFSPLEISQGAATLGIGVSEFLQRLRDAGLGTLPGTAAESLDDAVRAIICPDKISAGEWLNVIEAAHKVGIRTTSTIMFGHVEGLDSWALHLLALRDLQERTGGFTEFVPLPFVAMEAPVFRKGGARRGPTLREAVLMHAVSRLALHGQIANIQTSWVKMGETGVRLCLQSGANDLGGTLMNESISRAAGTQHGQELPPPAMRALIRSVGRIPQQRDTLYRPVDAERETAAENPADLAPLILTAPNDPQALSRRSA
ncbi:5-amino-6-(D-ribitylamino)uracil--L-tyrosine 4-hydroxyphenyl transferase CofH [Ferrovibrio sp.]|uniref:5-amino-6-(D-ribitylamino)uracil--L-tyrosine 4-hydroxyphenyl transferase CofH n=1 Tax=Ferrovibrio sp. TaxID=1917215 RepID=UPI0025BD0CD4|nr:5-amino-6-(D-ribitylamino)uracil--L-tyrosine 4-hydroxyphenyl transferase CofH [Ferrovibrio sp.]MBX3453625.1 5-amino-6-(D-ribitylamino)uracil--L-tyrosine 4-hydroxyphenyl transferase CofH [Ferrovibrio sp.]